MELHIIEPTAVALERRLNSVTLVSGQAVEDDRWSTLGQECSILEILVAVECGPDQAVAGRVIGKPDESWTNPECVASASGRLIVPPVARQKIRPSRCRMGG
jgi:hypothetical protein